jgi:hypothetical protein
MRENPPHRARHQPRGLPQWVGLGQPRQRDLPLVRLRSQLCDLSVGGRDGQRESLRGLASLMPVGQGGLSLLPGAGWAQGSMPVLVVCGSVRSNSQLLIILMAVKSWTRHT